MKYLLIVFAIASVFSVMAQNDKNNANVWYFGNYAGLDFNGGTPVGLTDGALFTYEGCATICNQDGELLFYTDGSTVWNREHEIMPNGSGLMGNSSASQAAIIVPIYTDTNLYYVFTVDARENSLNNGLRYSIVNMSWDGGLGDVTFTKNILLHAPVCEKVIACYSNNMIDFWIITHEWETEAFYAFKVTASGVQPPVITNIGLIHQGGVPSMAGAIGQIKVSPESTKMIVGLRGSSIYQYFTFNNVTGVVSDPYTLIDYDRAYTGEFSTDGKYLYIIDRAVKEIHRYNALATNETDFINSKEIIDTILCDEVGAMQMGPDGNIYISKRYHDYLAMIENPDSTNPTYVDDAVYLEGRTSEWGLPNIFYYKGWSEETNNVELLNNEISCFYSSGKIVFYNPNNLSSGSVRLFNIQGQEIYRENINNIEKGRNQLKTTFESNYQLMIYEIIIGNNVYKGKVSTTAY